MAEEEEKHVAYLSDVFKKYQESAQFLTELPRGKPGEFAKKVLSKEICAEITAADYEGAAIAASVEMEKAAVQLYSDRADRTDDDNEKQLYEWLAQWEREHLRLLAEINNDLMEEIWQKQNFWPY
jgi:rubrerythrin